MWSKWKVSVGAHVRTYAPRGCGGGGKSNPTKMPPHWKICPEIAGTFGVRRCVHADLKCQGRIPNRGTVQLRGHQVISEEKRTNLVWTGEKSMDSNGDPGCGTATKRSTLWPGGPDGREVPVVEPLNSLQSSPASRGRHQRPLVRGIRGREALCSLTWLYPGSRALWSES